MAKYPTDRSDPYVDQTSGILRNVLGITDQAELDRAEAALVALRANELSFKPLEGQFDLAHLQAIHRYLFKDIYAWAGEIRAVDITKGTTRFASHEQIESYAPQITRPLAREGHLQNLGAQQFSERAGHYLGELNALHPFREGNGRSIREFIDQLANAAGYSIHWQDIGRADMTEGAILAYHGDSSRLATLIRENLHEPEREHAFDLAAAAGHENIQLVRAAPGHTYAGVVIGVTERYVVQDTTAHTGQVVLHDRRAILNVQALAPGKDLDIRYPHGHIGVANEVPPAGRSHGRDMERTDFPEHEQDLDR